MVRTFVPREFFWNAPLWQADVDAFGELRNVTLLRLLQETATRASTDAGFDPTYYTRTGTKWIIRRTSLTVASAARYGDVLAVRTWIADFRRVRSQREYEVRVAERLIARASTDWVFVDAASARPRCIPAEWESTFMPDGATTLERVPFPEATPTPNAKMRTRRIELHELDALRHVNNSNYVSYVEQGLFDFTGTAGWDLDRQIRAGGRLRALSHDLEYLDAALYGEKIAVTAWPTAVTSDSMEVHTHLHRGDARPLLQARSRYRWTSTDGDSAIPRELAAAFRVP